MVFSSFGTQTVIYMHFWNINRLKWWIFGFFAIFLPATHFLHTPTHLLNIFFVIVYIIVPSFSTQTAIYMLFSDFDHLFCVGGNFFSYAYTWSKFPSAGNSRPKYSFAKIILVISLISSEILAPAFWLVRTENNSKIRQNWLLRKMTLPIPDNFSNAIWWAIKQNFVQFSESNNTLYKLHQWHQISSRSKMYQQNYLLE